MAVSIEFDSYNKQFSSEFGHHEIRKESIVKEGAHHRVTQQSVTVPVSATFLIRAPICLDRKRRFRFIRAIISLLL